MAVPIDRIVEEVEAGLSTEARSRMSRVEEARSFYNFDGLAYMSEFLNDAETAADFIRRPYRESGLCRGMTDVLCEHVYAPGPARTWEGTAGDDLLQRVYDENHINSLMQRADQLATLGDCAAIQVDAGRGRFGEVPMKLRLWAADEFAVWEDPDDRLMPVAVCTRDMYDEQTRYRLWTDDAVRTFLTEKASPSAGGGRAVRLVATDPNPYGIIPFAFVHYTLPVNTFWEPGIGDFLTHAESRATMPGSRDLTRSILKHLNLIPILINAYDNFQMDELELARTCSSASTRRRMGKPGHLEQTSARGTKALRGRGISRRTSTSRGRGPTSAGITTWCWRSAATTRTAWRMEQTGVASGIALIVEQAPLLTRARRRQLSFNIYECDLARVILACAGKFYRRPQLVAEAAGGKLAVTWPLPNIPIQTDDWLQLQLMRYQAGLTSKIAITMDTYGCSRDQAIAILEQVKEDRELEDTILPEPPAPPPLPDDEDGGGGDDEGYPEPAGANGNGVAS